MHTDTLQFVRNCSACSNMSGGGKVTVTRPCLHLIPVQRPFHIIDVDVMDLPKTRNGHSYVI